MSGSIGSFTFAAERSSDAELPRKHETRMAFVSEQKIRGGRSITLYEVRRRETDATLYGPASWRECLAFRKGLPS